MSHITHLLADLRRNRTPRKPQPFDSLSKAELWERLQAAEAALSGARRAAQRAATMAHDYAQGTTGEVRQQLLSLRDAAYKARDAQ
jgi:transposase